MKPSQKQKDIFYNRAKSEEYRARSAYKLLEINKKFNVMGEGDIVIDLGAAPGSWSQVALDLVGPQGFVLAIDILPVAPIETNFKFIMANIKGTNAIDKIEDELKRKANVVISDAAPEFSGIKSTDFGRVIDLNKSAFNIAKSILCKGGNFVFKSFQNPEVDNFIKILKKNFTNITQFKPKSSLRSSAEIYIVCKNFK